MVVLIVLLIVPQTGTPIKVAFQRLFAFSPDSLETEDQTPLETYNWPLEDMNGNKFNLKQSQGKLVFINLWATWCPPCIAEMPAMQQLYNDYGDKIDFYFVSNEAPGTIVGFMNKKQYDLPVYTRLYAFPADIESNVLPTTMVVDQNGTIVLFETGAKDWDSPKFYEFLDGLLTP